MDITSSKSGSDICIAIVSEGTAPSNSGSAVRRFISEMFKDHTTGRTPYS